MELPKYCHIAPYSDTDERRVHVRCQFTIPNMGTTPYETDEDIVQNFWD